MLVVGFCNIQWVMGVTTSYVNESSDNRKCNKYLLSECCGMSRAIQIEFTCSLLKILIFHYRWILVIKTGISHPGLEVREYDLPCLGEAFVFVLLVILQFFIYFSSYPFSSLRKKVVSELRLKFILPETGGEGRGSTTISSSLFHPLCFINSSAFNLHLLQHCSIHLLFYVRFFFHPYLLSAYCLSYSTRVLLIKLHNERYMNMHMLCFPADWLLVY